MAAFCPDGARHSVGMVAGPVDPMPSLGLYVKERGSGEDEELGEERMPIAIFIASW